MRPPRPPVLLALALLACTPEPITGPAEAWVVARDGAGDYGLQRRTLEIDDLRQVRGPATEMTARPRIGMGSDPSGLDLQVTGGRDMDLRLHLEDGAWIGSDFDALMAITVYHHIDESRRHFEDLGLGHTVDALPPIETLYHPSFVLLGGIALPLLTDNAGYAPLLSAFLIFDELVLDALPLGANEGVIAHEVSHAIFHHLTDRVHGHDVPRWMAEDWPDTAVNHWRSVDEGLADVHGAALTGDPDFIRVSTAGLELDRDVSVARTHTEELEERTDVDFAFYDPYPLGSVVASTFWDFGRRLEAEGMPAAEARRSMAEAAFDGALALEAHPAFHTAELLETVARRQSGAFRAAWCASVAEAFDLILDEVPTCAP